MSLNLAAGLAFDPVLLLSGLTRERAAGNVTEVRVELKPELRGRVRI